MSFPKTPSYFCGGASWLSILCGLSITPMEKDIIEHHLFTLNLWVIFVMFSVWTQAKWSQRFYVNWSKFYLEISWWSGCSFDEVVVSHLEQSRTRSLLNVSSWQTLSFQHFPWVQHTHTCSCAQKAIFIGEGRRTTATMKRMLVGTWSHLVCGRAHIWWLLGWSHSR